MRRGAPHATPFSWLVPTSLPPVAALGPPRTELVFAHLLYVLAGKDAGLPARREVAVNLEGVAGAALVGVDPVLT